MSKYLEIGSQQEAFMLLDEHTHNVERWFGAKAGANETNAMDTVLTPFQVDSGNDAWGAALCIVGSGDTPIEADMTHFHLSRLLVVARERFTAYMVRIAWGASYAAAITAGTYTELMLLPADENAITELKLPRIAVGTKVFAACWNVGNTGTLDFFTGIHESKIEKVSLPPPP